MGEAFITRRGGGGGHAGLNFEIVGGTTRPANPKENTIWANTAQKVTRWDFIVANPYLVSKTKNLICHPFYDPGSAVSGVTYTDNGDGTVNANGTAIADAAFRLSFIDAADNAIYLPAGDYFLSGCPAGGSSATYRVECKSVATGETLAQDYGSGAAFALDVPQVVRCNIVVASGATVSGLTFNPQLEKGSAATAFVKGDATGQLWLRNGTSSGVEFNALKKNGIQVYPISAKQYIDGAWVDVPAQSYQGGEWVDWWTGTYLFDEGDQCVDITGGWEKGGLSINGAQSDGVYTIGDTLTVTTKNSAGTTGRQSAIVTKKAVDVSGYKTLKVVVDNVSDVNLATYYCCFGLSENKSAHTATKAITGTGELSMDISALSGSYYPFIQVSNSDRKLVVSKIWLE